MAGCLQSCCSGLGLFSGGSRYKKELCKAKALLKELILAKSCGP
eukprot:CAMPEP_0185903512 /NCGR_PEP_ID=MMETSP0196C-20130402/2767_1 /TAXON_ID=2932 /ORGANISM="Alexandrium fundyense, Strain CCMP1719" /LENGTH=43 /DNA_ID= /DNA_START= /DNA_END= /DNA_ORIENTATION=